MKGFGNKNESNKKKKKKDNLSNSEKLIRKAYII